MPLARYRNLFELRSALSNHEGEVTASSLAQNEVEECILVKLEPAVIDEHDSDSASASQSDVRLHRKLHRRYLSRHIKMLPYSCAALEASRPWIVYWILHAWHLLTPEQENTASDPASDPASCIDDLDPLLLPQSTLDRAALTLLKYQHDGGGFGGGCGQMPHLATTYAAVHALAYTNCSSALLKINRRAMLSWLLRLKRPDASFVMHENGETDLRGVYCAVATAKLLGILTPELAEGCAEYIARCQAYDGGIGALPGAEAHGGYTYCGLAAVILLEKPHVLNLDSLLRWASARQKSFEGGFCGRSNKLVDGCYSFWIGSIFTMLHDIMPNFSCSSTLDCCNSLALHTFILHCCQNTITGGLLDKPTASPDLYHTCYVLSGLSITTNANLHPPHCNGANNKNNITNSNATPQQLSLHTHELTPVDPLHNISRNALSKITKFFEERHINN